MKLSIILTTTLVTIGLTATPALSQRRVPIATLNNQLLQAVCTQNWQRSIQIVDQIKTQLPQYTAALTAYQGQLEAWRRSGVQIPNWSASCRANPITLTTEGTAGGAANTADTATPGTAAPATVRGMW